MLKRKGLKRGFLKLLPVKSRAAKKLKAKPGKKVFLKKELPKDLNSLVNGLLLFRAGRLAALASTPVVILYDLKVRKDWSYAFAFPLSLAWMCNRATRVKINKIFEKITTSENPKIKDCAKKYPFFYITHLGRLVFSERKPLLKSSKWYKTENRLGKKS